MTILKNRWWVLIAVSVVILTTMGCSSEDKAGTLDYTRTEIVDFLTASEVFECIPLFDISDDEDGMVARCDVILERDDLLFSIFFYGEGDEVNRVEYDVVHSESMSDELSNLVQEFSIQVLEEIEPYVFGEECGDCDWWFTRAFEQVTRTSEEVHTSMEGIYVIVKAESLVPIPYRVIMNATLRNTDISKHQERYSCDRLADRAIEISEDDDEAITITKIYNLEPSVEYDIDMHIRRIARDREGWNLPNPLRISECRGQALTDTAAKESITIYTEEYEDGDIFTGYRLR